MTRLLREGPCVANWAVIDVARSIAYSNILVASLVIPIRVGLDTAPRFAVGAVQGNAGIVQPALVPGEISMIPFLGWAWIFYCTVEYQYR